MPKRWSPEQRRVYQNLWWTRLSPEQKDRIRLRKMALRERRRAERAEADVLAVPAEEQKAFRAERALLAILRRGFPEPEHIPSLWRKGISPETLSVFRLAWSVELVRTLLRQAGSSKERDIHSRLYRIRHRIGDMMVDHRRGELRASAFDEVLGPRDAATVPMNEWCGPDGVCGQTSRLVGERMRAEGWFVEGAR